jgi:hypothetical protein
VASGSSDRVEGQRRRDDRLERRGGVPGLFDVGAAFREGLDDRPAD